MSDTQPVACGSRHSAKGDELTLQAASKLGLTWQALPGQWQQSLCIKYLNKPAKPCLLPYFRTMLVRSGFDIRLTALCVKLHLEQQLHSDAYQMFEHSLVKRTRGLLQKSESTLAISGAGRGFGWFRWGGNRVRARDFRQYLSDVRVLAQLWAHVEDERRRDVAVKHQFSDEVKRLFTIVSREYYQEISQTLSEAEHNRFFSALLDLAKIAGSEEHARQAYGMFMRSPGRHNVAAYTNFMGKLHKTKLLSANCQVWEEFLATFKDWVDRQLPDAEGCCNFVFQEQRGAKTQLKYRLRNLGVVLSALKLSERADIAGPFAEKVLDRTGDTEELMQFCVGFLDLADEVDEVRLRAGRTLQGLFDKVPIDRSNFPIFVRAFLLLNDRDRMIELRSKGLLENHPGLSLAQTAQIYALIGDFEKAVAEASRMRSESIRVFAEKADGNALSILLGAPKILNGLRFLEASSEILQEVPQPRAPKGILVLLVKGAAELNLVPLLAIRELKQRGFATVSLVSGILDHEPTGIAEIDQISGQLSPSLDSAKWQASTPDDGQAWVIDEDACKMLYNGIDVYWGVREYLCCRGRRYSIDFRAPATQTLMRTLKRRIELIGMCLRKISEIGKRLNLPIRIVVPYVHVGTHYYARQYLNALSASQDIALIQSVPAYENYFANFGTDVSTTLAVQDMTDRPDLSAASYAPADVFERHYRDLADKQGVLEQTRQWIRQNRVQRKAELQHSARLEFLKSERQGGKKVVCVFGKVLFDLYMPRGDGAVHADMRDWFEHSIAIASKNDHVHLVIKPHPHEVRDEIALYPTEFLKDWLPASLPSNVHVLGHDEFNLFELADVLDLALLWNGTSALELGVLGIPTVIGAYYSQIDFPVGHIVPNSRSHYEELIASREIPAISPEVALRSAALINYFRHPEIATPYRYTHRGLTNKSIRTLRWFPEDLEAYRAHGDANVAFLADRIAGTWRGS